MNHCVHQTEEKQDHNNIVILFFVTYLLYT